MREKCGSEKKKKKRFSDIKNGTFVGKKIVLFFFQKDEVVLVLDNYFFFNFAKN